MANLPVWLGLDYERLTTQAQNDRLPHAILIAEPRGAGGELLVAALVRDLLNLPSSNELKGATHDNLMWLDVDVLRERDSSSRRTLVIDVESIRTIIGYLHKTANSGNLKIVVIGDAHLMNIQASNAFLKILEEPPANCHLFLVSSAVNDLLPTIRSRCSRISLRQPSEQETVGWLLEQNFERRQIETYLLDYGPAPLSIRAAMEGSGVVVRECLIEACRNKLQIPSIAEKLLGDNPDSILSRWQRSAHRLAMSYPGYGSVFRYYEELCDLRRQLHESPALNWRLQFERMLVKWVRLYESRPRKRSGSN